MGVGVELSVSRINSRNTFTNPHTATMMARKIMPHIIIFRASAVFSSSPPAVMYLTIPHRKITVARRIRKVIMILRKPERSRKISSIDLCADAARGARAKLAAMIVRMNELFIMYAIKLIIALVFYNFHKRNPNISSPHF